MFNLNDFIALMKYFKDGTVGDLDTNLIIQANDSKARTTLLFNENIDLSCFSSNDYKRLKEFLISWYASIRTFSSTMKNASDIRSLPEEHLNELIRSSGFVDGLDDIARLNKDDFFYSLVDLYKIKGTPESLLTVLGFFGIPDLEILEYWLQYDESSDLIFRPQLASLTPSKFNMKDLDYTNVVVDDPHWMLTESQINQSFLNNKIAFPSKSPYFGIRPITQLVGNIITPTLAILSRTIQDTYANYISGQTITKDIKLSVNIYASILDLYMGVLYAFNTLYPKTIDSSDLSFLIYGDSTSLTNIEIIDLYDDITKRSATTTRDEIKANRELFYDKFTRLRSTNFITSLDTAGNLLTTINNELKVLIDYCNSNGNLKSILKTLLKDLSTWIKSNISSAAPDLIILLFGILELDYIIKVINFFKPYRARIIPIEQIYTINIPVLDSVITEDDLTETKITETIVDFDTGDSIGSCCPPDEIPCLDSTATIYYTRNTFDCGSEFDIGASVDDNFMYISQEDDIIYNYHDGDATACIDTEFSGDEYFALQSGGFTDFDSDGLYDAPQISDVCKILESAQSFLLNGYIDELRLSTGVGRYAVQNERPYTADGYTQLLLHMDGTHLDYVYDNAQYLKPVWKDSSGNNHPIFSINAYWSYPSLSRCPYIDCDVSKFGGASGNFGYDRQLYVYGWPQWSGILPDSLQPQGGDFTIDCWIYFKVMPSWSLYNQWHPFYQIFDGDLFSRGSWLSFGYNGNDHKLFFIYSGASGGHGGDAFSFQTSEITDDPPVINKWFHVALVRYGTSFKLYWQGKCVGSTTQSVTFAKYTQPNASIIIGGRGAWGGGTEINIDELRYSNIARWTSNLISDSFTPDEYTKLLLHMNGTDGSTTFTDSSIYEHAVTSHRNIQVKTDQYKFGGAAGYGTQFVEIPGDYLSGWDYLSIPDSTDFHFGSDNFTIDFWWMATGAGNSELWAEQNVDETYDNIVGFGIYVNNIGFEVIEGGISLLNIITEYEFNKDEWYHIVLVRKGLTTNDWLIFVNGVSQILQITGDSSISIPVFNIPYTILFSNGRTDEFRISKGIARWTTDFTTPTDEYNVNFSFTPETSEYSIGSGIDSYTTLMLHGNGLDDGTIITDSSTSAKAVTNYDVLTKTGTKKFGSAALYFNGSNSYLTLLDDDDWYFGEDEFTIDFWLYLNDLPTNGNYYFLVSQTNENDKSFYIAIKNINDLYYFEIFAKDNGITLLNLSNLITISTGTWYHFAVERFGDTVYMFQNGIKLATTYDVTDIEMPNINELLYVGGIKSSIIVYVITEDGSYIIDYT